MQLENGIKADTIKHQMLTMDKAYHVSKYTKEDPKPRPEDRKRVTEYSPRQWLDRGNGFRPHDNKQLIPCRLIDFPAGRPLSKWPTGDGRKILTVGIEFATFFNIEWATTSNFKFFVELYNIDKRVTPMDKNPNADVEALKNCKDAIKKYRQ